MSSESGMKLTTSFEHNANNPTSVPGGSGSQLDTSWPTLLGQKLGAQVLNFGLSGGAWAENTVQSDTAAAIVNRVSTQDPNASADIIIISSFNDFKLYTPLGSSDPTNKNKTTYYGAMRTTYETLFTKYPGKRIYVVLPQKRYDENITYNGGASYKHYIEAQIDVANEYSIPVIDLNDIMPGKKGTAAYNTYMLNDTHWNAVGNDRVAELVARHLIGGGNSANRKELPPLPQTDGKHLLEVNITNGIPSFNWIENTGGVVIGEWQEISPLKNEYTGYVKVRKNSVGQVECLVNVVAPNPFVGQQICVIPAEFKPSFDETRNLRRSAGGDLNVMIQSGSGSLQGFQSTAASATIKGSMVWLRE